MDVNEELKFLGKFKKKWWGGVRGSGWGGGGQDGCERRIEVFEKIPKKKIGGGSGGRGVRVDVNEEFKFLGESKKKKWGVRGVGLRGQDGCERRIEVFVKIQNKKMGRGSGWM